MKAYINMVVALLSVSNIINAQPQPTNSEIQSLLDQIANTEFDDEVLFPKDYQLDAFQINDEKLRLLLTLPNQYLEEVLTEELHEELLEQITARTSISYKSVSIEAKDRSGTYQSLSSYLGTYDIQNVDVERNNDPLPFSKGPNRNGVSTKTVQPQGFLSGKTVWLSAGHGWKFDHRKRHVKTQRGNHHGIVEDFATAELVNYYLLKYLYQAGANVWTVRERDMNPNEVIISNEDGKLRYKETGNWKTSRSKGYSGKSYRYAISNRKKTSTASFHPTIPESGLYWVSVHYRAGLNRSTDTRYEVHHAGGVAEISINQEIHGSTWVYLGQFYFEKGSNQKVVLSNASGELGQAIIADAVRFGGGQGSLVKCFPSKTSGEPRFEESASLYASFQGFPYCINDVMTRPAYAEWELAKGSHEESKHSIYVSLHTNANGGRGTESFVHSYKAITGSWSLQNFIHKEVIKDIRREYDHTWKDRGRKAADFGELRGLKTMPGVLLEVAFHDHLNDAKALKDPAFRDLVGRAIYRGIVRYFANKTGKRPLFIPEPPSHLYAKGKTRNRISVSWRAPQDGYAPAYYKVYKSEHGKAFSAGTKSYQTNYTFNDLEPGKTYYFKVTAINKGGESFPSSVVAVKLSENGQSNYKYLMVDGFDRLDSGIALKVLEQKPAYRPLGETSRLLLEKMNNFDYMVDHAKAFDINGMAFDGATNEAVIAQDILMNNYDGVNWYLGRESVNDQTLNSKEQELLKKYFLNGGNLIISGSELAYDLDRKDNGKDFYQQYLKASYRSDDAGSNVVYPSSVNQNRNQRILLKNNEYNAYPLKSPDEIYPTGGGEVFMKYQNGKIAGTAYRREYGMVNLSFPLETIGDIDSRIRIVKKTIDYLHHNKQSSDFITYIPNTFDSELSIDLSNLAEGAASFKLLDEKGNIVYRKKWAHYGRRIRTLHPRRLAQQKYTYELEILGLKQTGVISKIDLMSSR